MGQTINSKPSEVILHQDWGISKTSPVSKSRCSKGDLVQHSNQHKNRISKMSLHINIQTSPHPKDPDEISLTIITLFRKRAMMAQ